MGQAAIDITAGQPLALLLAKLQRFATITGSEASQRPGTVRLIIEGDGVPTAPLVEVTVEETNLGDLWETKITFTPVPDEADADDTTRCEACLKPMKDGDGYYSDHVNGGVLHAECVGPELEAFTDAEGDPLPPGSPIPTPAIWSDKP